jgi:hypothetical protein
MISLLARGDDPLDLPPSVAVKAPPFDDADMVFAAFLALREARGSLGILGSLEKAINPSFAVSDRFVFLNQIGIEVEESIKKRRKKR